MEEPQTIESPKEPLHTYIISTNKFLLLNLLTLNLYTVWWMYKTWWLFKYKEDSDILPVARAIFGLFFIYSLFNRIRNYARQYDYERDFSPILLFMGIIIVNVIPALPAFKEKFGVLSLLASLFCITK